jgi:Icc-related predicted phosphoesterase
MKIVAISDLHEQWSQLHIPECDVLIVAGDITYDGKPHKLAEFNAWAERLQDRGTAGDVVVIAGNHDLLAERNPDGFRAILQDVTYLQDESIEIGGLNIYGSPWTPTFGYGWAFNADRDRIFQHWKKIPGNTDILVTHGPAFGILDRNQERERCGCPRLRDVIEFEVQPKLHICGHIHEGYGVGHLGFTTMVNASVLNRHYQCVNKPVVIEL